jgi:hypothetical protein
MGRVRLALEVTSLTNPLAEGWRRTFEIAGYDVHGVVLGDLEDPDQLPPGWTHVSRVGRASFDVVASWWGLASARHSILARNSRARHVVIVDTYPNASRLLSELREYWAFQRDVRSHPDVLLCYSDEMARALRRRLIGWSRAHIASMLQPFPLAMHRDRTRPAKRDDGVIFTGRSDLLLARDTSMAKDALGDLLQSIVGLGIPVTVQEPADIDLRLKLKTLGFSFYERLTNDEILDGTLGSIINQHGAQLCLYNNANSTISRRMRNGLSSRFAVGVTANTPALVPAVATSSARWVEQHGVGAPIDTAREVADYVGLESHAPFDRWRTEHADWSSEGQVGHLRRSIGC